MKIENFFYSFVEEKMETNENKNLTCSSFAYSWGEFYETTKTCSEYGDDERKKFTVFEALDKVTTVEEIFDIIMPLSESEINWLNSPCLDGIIISLLDPVTFIHIEYLETWKFYLQKKLITCFVDQICRYRHVNVVRLLLTMELDLDTKRTILRWAIRHDWIDIVKFLLKTKDIILPNFLCDACREGHTEIAKVLIENGANIDEENPLYEASRYGNIETVKLLLQYGANMNARNGAALRGACYDNRIEIVKLLLAHGADIHSDNGSILLDPTRYNKINMTKFLVENGANLHYDFNGPLRHVIFNKNLSLARFLLKHGSGTDFLERWNNNNYVHKELHVMTNFLLLYENNNRYDMDKEYLLKNMKGVLNNTPDICLQFL